MDESSQYLYAHRSSTFTAANMHRLGIFTSSCGIALHPLIDVNKSLLESLLPSLALAKIMFSFYEFYLQKVTWLIPWAPSPLILVTLWGDGGG